MKKQIYRIEILTPAGTRFKFWIGPMGELVKRGEAIPVTHEEHLEVMERIACPAVAYRETDSDKKEIA